MARPGPSITRRTVSRLHRWIALTLGLWFAFAGITGSVLVFWKEIDAGPAPVSADGPHQPMADLLAIARREWPASALIYRILPGRADEALRIDALVPDAQGLDRRHMLYLHPVTGAVLREDAWGDHWIHTLYNLHGGNLGSDWAATAVGFAGIAFLLLIAAGAWLWTRHDAIPLREGLRPVSGLRGLRRRRNLHRSFGLWAALPLAIAAATGVTLRFPDTTRAALAAMDAAGESLTRRTAKPQMERLTVDQAVDRARALLPGWHIAWMDLVDDDLGSVHFAMTPPGGGIAAPARISINMATGAIVGHHADRVETLRAWFMALHNGHAFGSLHRGFVMAIGLLPGFLGATGVLIWWRRRRNALRMRKPALA